MSEDGGTTIVVGTPPPGMRVPVKVEALPDGHVRITYPDEQVFEHQAQIGVPVQVRLLRLAARAGEAGVHAWCDAVWTLEPVRMGRRWELRVHVDGGRFETFPVYGAELYFEIDVDAGQVIEVSEPTKARGRHG